jgi:lipopolysaccharide export system protein LptC
VRIVRSGTGGQPDTVLTTTLLDVWPDAETARTDAPVTIAQGPTRISGGGLSADNKTSTYVLEAPVRGVFFRKENRPQPASLPHRSR